MHQDLTPVQDVAELEQLLLASNQQPLLLFKHSYSCGTSAEALDELIEHLNGSGKDIRYAMVTVQTHRELSNAVASKLGVRHETPQAILVRDGRVAWTAVVAQVLLLAVEG